VVISVRVKGGAVGGIGEVGAVFAVVPGGGVYVPAEAVGIGVEVEGAGVGATYGVEACDVGFGKLAAGEIYDL
jgi:hypothetical protein